MVYFLLLTLPLYPRGRVGEGLYHNLIIFISYTDALPNSNYIMKKVGLFLVVAIPLVFIIIWIHADKQFGELMEDSDTNLRNLKKVKIGMSVDSMVMIMGVKGSARPIENKNISYWYTLFTEDGDLSNLRIYVDSTGFVYEIFNPREFYKKKRSNTSQE